MKWHLLNGLAWGIIAAHVVGPSLFFATDWRWWLVVVMAAISFDAGTRIGAREARA